MPEARSYKLRLSRDGLKQFLRCHHRLALISGELIPYGATLYVAVALLSRLPPQELVGEREVLACARLSGDRTYFVGFSHVIAHLTQALREGAQHDATGLSVARLYMLGLLAFEGAEDREILAIYRASRHE